MLARKAFGTALAALLILALGAGTAADDHMQEWQDEDFGLSFMLPKGFKEKENTPEKFMAESADGTFVFIIVNWKDDSLTSQDAVCKALDALAGLDVKEVQAFEERNFDGGGKGYECLGTANVGGTDVEFGVVAIIDPHSARNMVAYTIYSAEIDGNLGSEREIIESIKLLRK